MPRFEKDDLPRLYSALGIPDDYRCEQGTYTTGMEALMILLRRLAYPNRLNDLTTIFGRRKSELSMIFNMVRNYNFSHYFDTDFSSLDS